jgi:hypothetical protein
MAKKTAKKTEKRRPYKWVRVPEDVYEQLGEIAEANDRSTNREAVRAIRTYIEQHKQERKNETLPKM